MPSQVDIESQIHDVQTAVQRLGHTSRFFSDKGRREVSSLAACIAAFLQQKWTRMLARSNAVGTPVLMAYMSDGWSTELAQCKSIQLGESSCRRVGRWRAEFLAEKSLLKSFDENGNIVMMMKLHAPRAMAGKDGWSIFGASLQHGFLRLSCPDLIVVSCYLQDGLHASSFLRRHRARHEIHYDLQDHLAPEAVFSLRAQDWVVGMRCILHVASSAIKWGLVKWTSEAILDDTHLCIKSLRNSSAPLQDFVSKHVLHRVFYEDAAASIQERGLFWTALGVPAPLLEFVLSVDPRWDPDRELLLVRMCLQDTANAVDTVEGVVSYFLQWRNWSDTRWAGVGVAARHFIGSLCVGVESLVALVDREGVNNEKFYLGASRRRMSTSVKKYVAIAALACYPLEGFTLSLLEDDRFLLQAAELHDDIKVEAEYVGNLPDSFWDMVARLVAEPGYDGGQLRSDTLEAIRTSMAYLDRNAYADLRCLPMSLTQGDVDKNLQELLGKDIHDADSLTKKIHFCARFLPRQTRQAFRLVQDMPCGIGLVEKGHAAGAFVRRHHATLGEDQLEVRAFVNEARPLFRPSLHDRSGMALSQEFESLLAGARKVRYKPICSAPRLSRRPN
jgi:hypothetical protein